MRVLIIPSPVTTHFMPMIPLAWALRAAGHELLVAGQPDVMGVAGQAGLHAVRTGEAFRAGELLLSLLPPGKRPVEAFGRWTTEQMSVFPPNWAAHSESVLPRYLEIARAYRPDLVLADPMEVNSLVVAGVLGVPVVHHRYGVDEVAAPFRVGAAKALQERCERLGLDGLPEPTVTLDPCPPGLQLPCLDPGVPIRYVPYNGSGEVPGWLQEERLPGTGRRRVAVSMGSMALDLNGVPLLRRVLDAFEGLPDAEAIATVGEAHRAELGPVPGNVRLVDPLPLHLLVGSCDAMIHHGGTGTSMTALAVGLPQLSLPQVADQFANADRLAATGIGPNVADAAAQNDPVRVREAVEALLSTPGHGKTAREMQRAMAAMPSPAQVAAELERLVRTGGPR